LSKSVRILPLGGLGEIGKNMTVVELDGRIVVIDVGLMFPTAEMLGIDLVLPDFSYLRDRADDIEAIVLTHGHEDHVGALPFVLREIGMPPKIYSGPLTIGLVRSKLEEHKLAKQAPLTVLELGERRAAGPFEIEMIHMSHSIPDARAVALHTPLGPILFTGDYRFDQTPVDGRPADIARLAEPSSARRAMSAPPSRASARRCSTSSRAARGGSSSPASPPTSTGSSRWSTPRSGSTGGSPWSVARCARTSTSPPTWGSPTHHRAC